MDGATTPMTPVDEEALVMVEITPEGGMILAAVAPATTLGLNIPREAVGKALTEIPLPLTLSASLTEGVQRSLDNDRTVIVRIPMDEISPEGRYWRITPLHDRNGHQPNRALCRLEWAISERFGGNAGADWFQTVIDAIPVPIFIKGLEGRYVFCNRAFGAFNGRPVADFIGRSVFEIAPAALASVYHQADLSLLATGGRQVYEAAVRRPSGGEAEVVFYKSVFTDSAGRVGGLIGAILDISERKAAERALTEHMTRLQGSEARLASMLAERELIIEHATTGIVFIKEGRIHRANRRFCEIFGLPPTEVIGLSLQTVTMAEAPSESGFFDLDPRAHPALARGECYEQEMPFRSRDGLTIWCFLKGRMINPADPDRGTIWVVEDITNRRHLMRELREATLAAQQANRMKSQFLVTMSHELRTPLNAVLGFSEIIKDQLCGPVANERYVEYAGDIFSCGEHLLSLINDILDLSKIEAGRMTLESCSLDLTAILGGAIRLVHRRAQSRNLDLRLDIADPAPALTGDERAIKQILFNLLTNAIKFTSSGGTVTLSAVQKFDGDVVLCVNDTGIGIPRHEIERIMRPFEQLDNRYAHAGGGTGLGMALIKALTELHGGRMQIESEPGIGTCVSILLPGGLGA
jgi:PAS domain S-box-containing protein